MPASLDQAFALHQSGDLDGAVRLYKEIIAADPLNADALHMMGVVAKQKGNNELALKLIETALGQRPSMPLAWHNRSLILKLLGRNDEALQSAEQAVGADAHFAEAWDMLGFLLREKRDFARAREAHGRAVALRPDDLKFLGNYAQLLYATGEIEQAYAVLKRIEARDATLMAHTMGNVLKAAGRPDLAIPYYEKSRAHLPDHNEIGLTEAMARLLIGDFAGGWSLWEQRPGLDPRFQNVPFWDGNPVEHLLLHEDQGIGDALQCARYIRLLKPYARRMTLHVTKVLHRLMAASFTDTPEVDVRLLDDPQPQAQGRIRLLSLPAFFKNDAGNIPAPVPYLFACQQWRDAWAGRLAALPQGPKIGIVWGGNPDHLNDRMRSIAFGQMGPLLEAGAAHLISLQKGAQKNAADLAARGIYDADPFLNDFADTAGLLAQMDLLITVDTSVAHLGGALGKPVWLLLPFDPDWRWLLGREDSPWYPTMRLYRQPKPHDWAAVVERVAGDLRRLIAGDGSVLRPEPWDGACLRRNPLALKLDETN